MSAGSKVTVAFAPEQTPGVVPTTGWQSIIRTSFGIKPTYNTNESNEVGSSPIAQAAALGTEDINGDLATAYRPKVLDMFLESVFGDKFQGNDKNAELRVGEERYTFSAFELFRDIAVHGIATGLQVSAMDFSFTGDNDVAVTTSMQGLGFNHATGAGNISPAAEDTFKKYGFMDVSLLEMNGESMVGKACVDSFNVKFTRDLEAMRCLGSGLRTPGALIADVFKIDGQLTVAWSPKAYELWASQSAGNTVSLKFKVGNDQAEYWFDFPALQIKSDWPDAATGAIKATLSITTAGVTPVITRKLLSLAKGE